MHTTLDELLKFNFEEYQVMWNKGRYHSHNAYHLGSLALLGASDEQLKEIYDSIMRNYAVKNVASPHEITRDNWYESLGDTRFCSAYQDFFDKQLPKEGDWKKELFDILLDDTKGPPLIDASLCYLLHSIIHVSYAIELNSRPVACEALAMTAVCVDPAYKLTTDIKPPTDGQKGALQVMKDVSLDNNAPHHVDLLPVGPILTHETFLRSHYNQWQMSNDLDKTIEEFFDMSVYVYGATHKPNQIDFDFALLHFLTTTDAIRKIRCYLDDVTMKRLVCSFFYLAIGMYTCQRQPKIDEELVHGYKIKEDQYNWKYVVDRTLQTKLATESHVVKIIRALKDAEKAYGSKDGLYLKTAIKTVDNLNMEVSWDYHTSHEPWIGTADANRELNVKY